jgi:hypothetical protein
MDTVEREKARLATWLKAYCVLGANEATVDEDTATKVETSMVLIFIEIHTLAHTSVDGMTDF